MGIIALLLGVIVVVLSISIGLLLRRTFEREALYAANEETYANFYQDLKLQLQVILDTIKAVDINGSFEADDEVGSVFQEIKETISILENFQLEYFPEPVNAEE